MKTAASLGICALCCLVALIAAEAFGYETTGDLQSTPSTKTTIENERNLVKPANYGAGTNDLEPVLEYVPNDLAVYGHQHEKREIVTHPSGLDTLQWDEPQQHIRGRRLPFYIDEPRYVVIRQPSVFPSNPGLSFIPQRGRKSDPSAATALKKRELSIKQMLEGSDYFVPNRGKKRLGNGISKKIKFDDILGSDEPFIPNRGKKELVDFFPAAAFAGSSFGGGRTLNDLQPLLGKKNVLNAIQNVGSKEGENGGELFYPTRGKKNLLENLAQSQDTFFSSRGKRNPVIWSMLDEELSPWEYLTVDDSSYDAESALLDRYQTNKIIT